MSCLDCRAQFPQSSGVWLPEGLWPLHVVSTLEAEIIHSHTGIQQDLTNGFWDVLGSTTFQSQQTSGWGFDLSRVQKQMGRAAGFWVNERWSYKETISFCSEWLHICKVLSCSCLLLKLKPAFVTWNKSSHNFIQKHLLSCRTFPRLFIWFSAPWVSSR